MDAPSLYDLLVQANPDAQSAALQDALRKRAAVGALIQGIGGSTLGGVGSGMIDSADKGIEQIDQRAQRAQASQGQRLKMLLDQQQRAQQTAHQSDVFNETKRHNLATERTAGLKLDFAGRGTGSAQGGDDIKAIADAIVSGQQPPELKGLYKYAAPIRAELGRRGYDLSAAQSDWLATQKHVATMNGQQQERIRQAVYTVTHSLDTLDDLYKQWEKVGPASGFKVFNRAAIASAKNMPGDAGAVAQALEAQINDLTAELGQVYMGGNSPTDHALKLAGENLKADWNGDTFKKMLALARTNLQIRQNSLTHSVPVGASPQNPYFKGAPAPAPVAEPDATAAPPVRKFTRGKDGKLVEVK